MTSSSRVLGSCVWTLLAVGCPASSQQADETDATTGSSISLTGAETVTASDPTSTAPEVTGDPTSVDGSEESSASTVDSTSETTGGCVDDRECDNGVFCDGQETCAGGTCTSGAAVDCADDVDCTMDSCDAELDACIHEPSNAGCACGETCDASLGCGDHCVPAECQGQVYQCGNCIDDDGDCAIDSADLDCWGPCDNNESGYAGNIPGQQNQSTCVAMDCYFDQNSGAGNDDCYWSHSCDPLEPSGCAYDVAHNVPGTNASCAELDATQSDECGAYCGPLTPNGCDCFGCCDVTLDDDTVVTVYLGTLDAEGQGTCSLDVIDDPLLCHPCSQVEGCLNSCERCEICIGQNELPPECDEQDCPRGLQACGLPGQEPCPENQACVTGCCVPEPQ